MNSEAKKILLNDLLGDNKHFLGDKKHFFVPKKKRDMHLLYDKDEEPEEGPNAPIRINPIDPTKIKKG